MSRNHEDAPNYQHIKALVRDLRTTRNVARPENLKANNVQQVNSTMKACESISVTQKLLAQQFTRPHLINERRIEIYDDNDIFVDEDNTSDTNTSSLDLSMQSPAFLCAKRSEGNANIAVPSVIITDVNESLDLITSTQRRFSQLYLGLRRLSGSHTVRMVNECKHQKKKNDQQHAVIKRYCFV